MTTASEYRTAAQVLKLHHAPAEQVEFYEKKADKLEARDEYAYGLGVFSHQNRNEGFDTYGLRLMAKLAQDGWVMPDGLF